MKRANEIMVGTVVLAAIAVAVVGSIFLSQMRVGGNDRYVEARFRSIGGLKSGNPVQLNGVKIGTVDDITLGEGNWVNVILRLSPAARTPETDSVVAVIRSTTLFGDWGVDIMARSDLPNDPVVIRQVRDALVDIGDRWPGATLPDIGQITAQASRIAGDIAKLSSRVDSTFDSTSVRRLQNSLRDFSSLSRSLASIARRQEEQLGRIGANLDTGTMALRVGAAAVARAAQRADSATDSEQLQRIFTNADSAAAAMRSVAGDLRRLANSAATQDTALARLIANSDSIIARVQAGQGSLGMLTRDTLLYTEALGTVRDLRLLVAEIKANPRRFFSFSVF